jgi:hypothetical protein
MLALRLRIAEATTTSLSDPTVAVPPSVNSLRHVSRMLAATPCRRATSDTGAPDAAPGAFVCPIVDAHHLTLNSFVNKKI